MNQNRFHSHGIRAVKVTVLIVTAITLRAFKSGIMSIHLKVHQSETGMILRRGWLRHRGAGLQQDGRISNAGIFISHTPNLSVHFQREGKHGSSKTSVVQFPTQISATSPPSSPPFELQLSLLYARPNKQSKQHEGLIMCCGYCFNGAIRAALLGVHTFKSCLHNYGQPPATLWRVIFILRPCFHTQSSGRAVLPNLHIALAL